MGYKAKAKSLGAEFIHDEVVEILKAEGRVTGVRLSSGGEMMAKIVVNCSGAWAAKIAQTAGVRLPMKSILPWTGNDL